MAHDTAHTPAVDDPIHGGAHGSHADHGHAHHGGVTVYVMVFVALMVLLLATVGVAYINLGVFNIPVAYAIASLKAVLILWFFMHLNQQTRLVQVFAFASFAWLALFLIMMGGDYVGRHIMSRADPMTEIRQVDSYGAMSGVEHDRNPAAGMTDHRADKKTPSAERTDHGK